MLLLGTVGYASAERPIRLLSIAPDPAVVVYLEGTVTPTATFTFDNIGADGLRYRWYSNTSGSYLPIHAGEYIWFDKHSRSGTYALPSTTSTVVNDGDIVKVSVWLIKKNGGAVKGGSTSASWNVTSD